MFREFSRFFKFVGTDSAQFKTAGCSWLHWRHSSESSRLSRQSADYLVDQLQILSGSADFTNWSKVLRQFIRKSNFIQWLVKYQFHPNEVIFDRKTYWTFKLSPQKLNPLKFLNILNFWKEPPCISSSARFFAVAQVLPGLARIRFTTATYHDIPQSPA